MSRTFTPNDKIDLSLGAGASMNGAISFAAIVKSASDGSTIRVMFCIGNVAATRYAFDVNASDLISLRTQATTVTAPTITVKTADGWVLVAITKATGTATPRFHKYVFSTGTWTHENGAASMASTTPSGASGLAYNTNAGNRFWNGDLAVCGAWASDLASANDLTVEALAVSFANWSAVTANGLWMLNQASVATALTDSTGNGADQTAITGTTVSTNSPLDFWIPGSGSPTEANDTSTASGGFGPSGTSATTDADDTSSGSGTVTAPTTAAATVGSGRAANPRALADAQVRREHLRQDDEEILLLL